MKRQEIGPFMNVKIPYKVTNRRIFHIQVGKLSFSRQNFVCKFIRAQKFVLFVSIKIARLFLFPVQQLLSMYD